MSENLPAMPMILCPSHIKLQAGETLEVPLMPSEYPKEKKTTRRMRVNAEKKIRRVLDDLLEMESRGVILPGGYNAVIHVLTAVLIGKSAHAFSTEFWRLYGQVEAKWGVFDKHPQRDVETEMTNRLIAEGVSQQEGFRDYIRNGVARSVPLPVFVGNVLRHQGTNPDNQIRPDDIDQAVQFLSKWANE